MKETPSDPPPTAPRPEAAPAEQPVERREMPRHDTALLEVELHESRAAQARVRQDLADLLKAHRQQARLLERSQRAAAATEEELGSSRKQVQALEAEIADQRARLAQQAARVSELEAKISNHASLQEAHAALSRERDDLQSRMADLTRSRDNAVNEGERLSEQLTHLHARIAAKEAEIAALTVAQDDWKERVQKLGQEVADLRASQEKSREQLTRLSAVEAAKSRLQLEYDSLAARWEVAKAQLDEAEQALRTSQATIKAAQRLSASVEWRGALDGVLDAASELVRFERGTLALVDELQEELKIEAARNSPIAVSEMSRFKMGEGIAGWALSHREPVLVRDSRSDARFKASDPAHQPRSFIAVPLLSGPEALGVLTLSRSANDPFDDHDLRNVARVATDAANALIHARLVHVLKQRQDRLNALVKKAKDLWMAGDLGQVLEFVMTSAEELTAGTAALVALRDPKSQELEVLASHGIPDEVLRERIGWGAPAAMDVLRTGKPWAAPMRDMLPASLTEMVERAGLVSLISVSFLSQPLSVEVEENLLTRSNLDPVEEVEGVLHVYRRSAEPIPAGQLEQLQAFADHAAVAIRNVRRGERVRGQLQTTVSLNAKLLGRERYINQLQFRIEQLEKELRRFKAA
ncbi:MAG TPA: GAF domain-containing protein [Candidatus Limnocylindrales bacterium]|nr:GAF domain-containing protein [Candidatus Limnocylindrales bacterium]